MTLERRKPLERGKPLARGKAPARRGRVNPLSAKRRADLPRRAEVREAVFRRDGYRCRLADVEGAGPCFGRLEMHERRKASQLTDSYTVENGAALCSSHNARLESDADLARLARTLGLVLRRGDL